jgi:NAD(P)-dependent dehydrogenase (short-subunit alcohol dehydrogenase family)
MLKTGELEGKVALVTGGSSGIGRATAFRFAQEGARVAILARGKPRLDQTHKMIADEVGPDRVIPIVCDVTQESQVIAAFDQTLRSFGSLDIVVNNAGSMFYASIEDTTLEIWKNTFAVLATGYFLVSREAFRYWKKQSMPGSLVFVTSKAAQAASSGNSAYSAAKAAELHLARCLAEEGGPSGIRVNCVSPGAVLRDTALFSPEMRLNTASKYGIRPEDLEDYYAHRSALKVVLTPDHVADAILFLSGPRSAGITGALLCVDAGLSNAYAR